MQVFAITNQKGGVGKSTLACHLSWYLAELGRRVLHVDIDPQGNSSSTLADHATGTHTSRFFAKNAPTVTAHESGLTLAAADDELLNIERAPNAVLQHFCDAIDTQADAFDVAVIDTAPTAGIKMSAALLAATDVFAPIELEGYSIDGFQKLVKTVVGIKQKFNPSLNFIGALPNRFNAVSPTQRENLDALIEGYPQFIIPTKVPTRSAISDALREKVPVWKMTNKSSARDAGRELRAVLDIILSKSSQP